MTIQTTLERITASMKIYQLDHAEAVTSLDSEKLVILLEDTDIAKLNFAAGDLMSVYAAHKPEIEMQDDNDVGHCATIRMSL